MRHVSKPQKQVGPKGWPGTVCLFFSIRIFGLWPFLNVVSWWIPKTKRSENPMFICVFRKAHFWLSFSTTSKNETRFATLKLCHTKLADNMQPEPKHTTLIVAHKNWLKSLKKLATVTSVQNLSLNLVQNLNFQMTKIGPEPNSQQRKNSIYIYIYMLVG